MSDDLINKKEALTLLQKRSQQLVGIYGDLGGALSGAARLIDELPAADRPEGKWIIHFDDIWPEESTIECSVCHEEQPLEIDDNFCPNCGAKMKGANNE